MNAWTQLLSLPLTAFVYGLEFMVRTLQTAQQVARQIAIVDPNAGLPPRPGGGLDRSTPPIGGVPPGNATTIFKERREMSDCGCSRDQCGRPFCEVRVYEYYIISVKPCAERKLEGPESEVITTDMSGEAFSSFAIARYCKRNPNIPERDLQYLRCCYRVQCTFPKERKDCCTDDQVAILREIRDAIGGPRASAA